MGEAAKPSGPDFKNGVPLELFSKENKILGQFEGNPVLLIKKSDSFFAISSTCTHYSGNLNDGLFDGQTIHCPLHHACFDVATGRALKAPALNALQTWQTEVVGQKVFVRNSKPATEVKEQIHANEHFVIIGSGASGHAAAETLREEGFAGRLSLYTADADLPYDRPNLSKDYLAGNAPEEWIPLRPAEFYQEKKIDIYLSTPVKELEIEKKQIILKNGNAVSFDKCLIATGGSPRKLKIPGSDLPQVLYLRTLADSRKIIASLPFAKHAVIIGTGFIGMECAASLRARNIDVTVFSNEKAPLLKILGTEMADFIKSIYTKNGVKFHFEKSISKIEKENVFLNDDSKIAADLVIVGIGIEPNISLFKNSTASAGGIAVDEYLNTGNKDIFAAGDVALFPSQFGHEPIRAEHWAVAQWLGQTAAKNMLGQQVKFKEVPFFWSVHFDVTFSYLGSAKNWTNAKTYGSIQDKRFAIAYVTTGKISAALTVGLDYENLLLEQAFKNNDQQAIQSLLERIDLQM